MIVTYRILRIPDERVWIVALRGATMLLAQVRLSETGEWQDFIHPRRGGAAYDGSLERLVHHDVHEMYPDAQEEKEKDYE